ncbi:MAG: hypothetical protein JW936_04175 [Sedimentisphaerales bacterium]|nr:hypothetical protein [Sedimentisphaerales bacterium]
MKAEERHKLHQNELAEGLHKLPEIWEKQGRKIVTWALLVIIAGIAGFWFWQGHKAAKVAQLEDLQRMVVDVNKNQITAAEHAAASFGAAEAALLTRGAYNVTADADQLGRLADDQLGTPLGLTARLRQAELLRSQLYFSDVIPGENEKTALCSQVEALYRQLIADYPNSNTAVGAAKMGLALLSEDQGQWDAAVTQYQEIVALADSTLAGTIYPDQAQRRLAMLEDINQPIVLAAAPSGPQITAMPGAMVSEQPAEAITDTQPDSAAEPVTPQ